MTWELDISKIRSVKGESESYHLETDVFDFMDDDWQLAQPLVIDAEVSHQGQFLELKGVPVLPCREFVPAAWSW